MKGAQKGFSLVELLVALAIATILAMLLLRVITGALHWSALQAQRDDAAATAGELSDRFRADAASAWAIFTPPNDVDGRSNADGHELDFFTRDGTNRSFFWAYTYDATAQTITHALYDAPGAAPVVDRTYSGVTGFFARTYPVTALQDSGTPVYSALYANATLHAGAVQFYPDSAPWIAGGNQITYLRLQSADQIYDDELATATAPSGFTIVFRYTPKPSPTPAPLVVDPARIVFNVPIAVAYESPVERLAQLLGGGIAQASSCDGVFAYTSSGAVDANDAAIGTGANGCFDGANGANVQAADAGNTGAFNYAPNNCPISPQTVTYGNWTTYGGTGTQSNLLVGLATPPPGNTCIFYIQDPSHQTIPSAGATPGPMTAQPVLAQYAPGPCTPDSYGYCLYVTHGLGSGRGTCPNGSAYVFSIFSYELYYYNTAEGAYTQSNQQEPPGVTSCPPPYTWTPYNPNRYDPNLP